MNIYNHGKELRFRLSYLLLCFLTTLLFSQIYSLELIYLYLKPILTLNKDLICTSLTEYLLVFIKLGFLTTFWFLVPVFLYQLWSFIIPSCYYKEQKIFTKYIFSFVLAWIFVTPLYLFLILPYTCNFFLTYEIIDDPVVITLALKLENYFSLVLRVFLMTLLAVGVCFLLVFCFRSNLTTPYKLSQNRRGVWLFCFLLAAVLSPPDILTQYIFGSLLALLFELLLWIGFYQKKVKDNSLSSVCKERSGQRL